MKDHEKAQLVNQLRDVALEFHAAQQLRARIQEIIMPAISKIDNAEAHLRHWTARADTAEKKLKIAEHKLLTALDDSARLDWLQSQVKESSIRLPNMQFKKVNAWALAADGSDLREAIDNIRDCLQRNKKESE